MTYEYLEIQLKLADETMTTISKCLRCESCKIVAQMYLDIRLALVEELEEMKELEASKKKTA